MLLKELIHKQQVTALHGSDSLEVTGLALDSRKVEPGFAFFAAKGSAADGHLFISKAIELGAVAVICEELPAERPQHITFVQVPNTPAALGPIASRFYGDPSSRLELIGVTGTNGKTTVATLLFRLFRSMGFSSGLLSTVQNQIDDEIIPSTHTTPDAIAINALMARMVAAGCKYAFMECSSHAIHQDRIKGLHFKGGIFTNITHDHLDYHQTFDHYLKAKKKFFDQLGEDAFALTNKDDRNGQVMLQNTPATRYSYSLHTNSDFKARIIEHDFSGMLLNIDGDEFWCQLVGEFNAYNILAVYAAAYLCGFNKEELLLHLSRLSSVNGRFDYQRSGTRVTGIVDYAHTPDALKNVLETINKIRTRNEQLITVVGCGGDRDRTKRPEMAKVASQLSDKVIFTSDNPRSESPEAILDEMQQGVAPIDFKKTLRISDRKEAIKAAVSMAAPGDIILLAGKGHETYQEISGVKYPFDDKAVLREMFNLFQQ